MTYRNNQPPQNRPNTGGQWGRYPPSGARPGGYPNGGPQPRPKKRRGFRWQMLKFFLVLVLVAAVGAGIYVGKVYLDVAPYTAVFLNGVTVDGIDLGGMTWEEGNAAVRKQINDKLGSWYVRLRNENGYFPQNITAELLNIHRDPEEALESAWAVGHETSAENRKTIFDLQQEIVAAQEKTYGFTSAEFGADTSVIDDILAIIAQGAYIEAQDAKMTDFNPDNSLEPFTFQTEVVGRKLNTDALREQILSMASSFESGEIILKTESTYPEITVADLEQVYSLRARAVTPIDSHSSDARNENIKNAFSKINGLIVNSGSKFSFNGVVGRRTLENGFYRAFEYNYSELVWGIGGGVCQASTTVYLAAMTAGMDLIKHTPHAEKVSYTDLGMDATVSDTRGAEKDMSFRNNSGGQIFIAAHVIKDPSNSKRYMCEVRIYGLDLGALSYELRAVITKTLQPPADPIIVYDSKEEYVTFDDPIKVLREAAVGYVVDTYRITKENGAQIAEEKLTTSTYPAQQEKIAQWTQP